jgi:hypothetical protein
MKAALRRLTEGKLSLSSPAKLMAANPGLSEKSLHARLVWQDLHSVKEARMQLGHLPTASSVGSPKSPSAIPKTGRDEILRQSMVDLNPMILGEAVEDCLHRLQHQDISSILMLGCRFGANQPSECQILLVSAPMLAPVGDIKDAAKMLPCLVRKLSPLSP